MRTKEGDRPLNQEQRTTPVRSNESEQSVQVPFTQLPCQVSRYPLNQRGGNREEEIMRTLGKIAAALGVIGAIGYQRRAAGIRLVRPPPSLLQLLRRRHIQRLPTGLYHTGR
jgi:hypothetical protein